MSEISEILEDLIVESGLSLRKIGKECSVSASQLSSYLQGSIPTIDVAVRICNFFNCSLDYLCGLSDERKCSKKEYDLSKFLPRYQEVLKENKITHWKFCKENDISESCIRHWKYGQIPKLETVIKIAEKLSVSIDYLVGRSDKK